MRHGWLTENGFSFPLHSLGQSRAEAREKILSQCDQQIAIANSNIAEHGRAMGDCQKMAPVSPSIPLDRVSFLSDPGIPGPIYGSGLSHSLTMRRFADLTDVTLVDEDTGCFFNCSHPKNPKCQPVSKFWYLELFWWDLLCNLTLRNFFLGGNS